jgi:hypothetical protein
MPIYVFSHPKTGEIKEVLLPVSDCIVYSEGGVIWNREYAFNVAVKDSPVDPWKKNDFLRKTGEMKGNVGDMIDLSAELSEKRAERSGGRDPIKSQYFKEYSAARKGKRHLLDN